MSPACHRFRITVGNVTRPMQDRHNLKRCGISSIDNEVGAKWPKSDIAACEVRARMSLPRSFRELFERQE
jgi:hypothetical protein